jgi:excisionase family DNA binding protein
MPVKKNKVDQAVEVASPANPVVTHINIRQAATRSGLKVCRVRALLWSNKLPFVKLGREQLISVAALDDFMQQNLRFASGGR